MSNFHALELEVIRRAESMSILDVEPERYAFGTLRTVVDLCDAIALGAPIDQISYDMGRVAIDLIALCAMLDIDLAKSLETAFNKISAKPADTSNVVLLKRDQP